MTRPGLCRGLAVVLIAMVFNGLPEAEVGDAGAPRSAREVFPPLPRASPPLPRASPALPFLESERPMTRTVEDMRTPGFPWSSRA